MKAQEFLQQAYMLDHQIDVLIPQIVEQHMLAERMQSALEDRSVRDRQNMHALYNSMITIMELERELNEELIQLVALKKKIRSVIAEVKDVDLRLVLEKRYLCAETIPQVGKELGHAEQWVRTRLEAALHMVQKILDQFPVAS